MHAFGFDRLIGQRHASTFCRKHALSRSFQSKVSIPELNGKPGPAHLLELKDEIGLTNVQVAQITSIFEEMRSEAILAGERLIKAETVLSRAFEAEGLKPEKLKGLLRDTEAARAEGQIADAPFIGDACHARLLCHRI